MTSPIDAATLSNYLNPKTSDQPPTQVQPTTNPSIDADLTEELFGVSEDEELNAEKIKAALEQLNPLVTKLLEARKDKQIAQAALDAAQNVYNDLKCQISTALSITGLTAVKTDTGTVSVTRTEKVGVSDWLAFYKFIHENEAWYLLQKSIALTSCLEAIKLYGSIPGLYVYENESLSLRSAKK